MPHVRRSGEGTCRGTRRNAAGRVQGIEPRPLSFVEPVEPTPNKKDKSPSRRWATSGRYFWSHGTRRGSGKRACRSEEHTSEIQSLMRISLTLFFLKIKTNNFNHPYI